MFRKLTSGLLLLCLLSMLKPATAQETYCDTSAWVQDTEVYLDEFTTDIDDVDPSDVPAMTELYSRIMDAVYYYEDLNPCGELSTANQLMLKVLNGMQDRLFYVMSTIARREGLQINASIVESTVQPRYEENLALLNQELASLQSAPVSSSGLGNIAAQSVEILTLHSSDPDDIFGPAEVTDGFYMLSFDIQDSSQDTRLDLSADWTDGSFFWANSVLQGHVVYYFAAGSVAANVSFSDADSYTLTLSSAPLEPAESLSLSGTTEVQDVWGALFLEAGTYILTYQVKFDGDPINSAGILLQWVTSGEYAENIWTYESNDMEGRQLYQLDGGIYYINYEISNATEWAFSLTKQ
ncbi:MAG: hypothetical protein K8L91_08020 [Anaerolineae bacterium]|nr:MAG: hypothetical protein F9K46_07865 [Anaerolineae bacterium]MBZ0316349.1 hypothetical protein [Anaerolineae bacterium]